MSPADPAAFWPLRLSPGDDLRAALEAAVRARGLDAAFVVAGIGSLRETRLRLAGRDAPEAFDGDVELLSLCGTVGAQGSHLHLTMADAQGHVRGGHAAPGCIVRTTAEVLLAPLPQWHFGRAHDPATGWQELVIRPRG